VRKQKAFTFPNGSSLVVWQANWDISMERNAIEEQARADRARLNGSGDPELRYFQEMIDSGLAAASEGDVPALATAFQLPPEDLDAWHLAVAEVNPTWFTATDYQQEEIQIGERTITVLSLRPSVLMRRMHLEQAASLQTPSTNAGQETFRAVYYPRLAGCSLGDVPTEAEARTDWSIDELQVWYDAAKRLIPSWFLSLEAMAEQNQQASLEAQAKKKRRRARS
jgi:hypothetical protein